MESRIEKLINAVLNGDSIEGFTPQSRVEEYLLAAINESGIENLPKPQSRLDALLYEFADVMPESYDADHDAGRKDFITEKNGDYLFYKWDGDTIPLEYDDTSGITSMKNMFGYCEKLVEAPSLDTQKVTSMKSMFSSCKVLTDVPNYNTEKVIDMNGMFYGCTALKTAPLLNTKNVTNMSAMFQSSGIEEMPTLDLSSVENMSYMFSKTPVKGNVTIVAPKATDMSYLFYTSTALESADIDLSNVTNFSYALQGMGNSFINATLRNTQKLTDISSCFRNCNILEKVNATDETNSAVLDLPNVTDIGYLFYGCGQRLQKIELTTSEALTSMQSTFYTCSKVTYISVSDVRNVHNYGFGNAFTNCGSLTELYMRNIKSNLQIGSGSGWGSKIILDCLIYLIRELINVDAARTFTIGTANLAKLANVYVKLIDITDEMRAVDEFIDQKYPFEVCESTDEGAMLIVNYANTYKNWTIK